MTAESLTSGVGLDGGRVIKVPGIHNQRVMNTNRTTSSMGRDNAS